MPDIGPGSAPCATDWHIVKNNFKDVQIAFLGRITKVLQYGWFKGPRVRVGNRYDQAKIEYTLESFSIDEVFKGADLIKGKRDLLIAQSDLCHMWACAGSHNDNDEELRASERLLADRGQSVFLFCWSQGNDTDFMSGFLLRLRGELRKRGHSYDFAIFQNCSLANSEKPETLSIVRNYFDTRKGLKP